MSRLFTAGNYRPINYGSFRRGVSSPMANMRAQVIDRRNGGVDLLNCLAVENEIMDWEEIDGRQNGQVD